MTDYSRLILVLGASPLRACSEAEALASLTPFEQALPRTVLRLETREHKEAVDSGFWPPVETHLRALATDVRAELDLHGSAKLVYCGIDEVPTLIAFGAFLGDEHRIWVQDYDRDQNRFGWPSESHELQMELVGAPKERITTAGEVVIRIELTYPVRDDHVDEVVDRASRLADIRVRPIGCVPRPGPIRSQADLETFRKTFRALLSVLEELRPGTEQVHLFLAGPVSACIAAGQELRLRNGRRVQTYRHRSDREPALTVAMLLGPEASTAVQVPLTSDEVAVAQVARGMWRDALRELVEHSQVLRNQGAWPFYLHPSLRVAPAPAGLAPIWELTHREDSISPEDVTEFFFNRTNRTWHLPDSMLVAMHGAGGGEAEVVHRLARAFLWHEYLHDFQGLTHYTAVNIGGFANTLERVDYIADVFGILHQADFLLRTNAPADMGLVLLLCRCIEEAIDSFWTFEPRAPTPRWQQRRLRRYLNWYWRRVQIANANSDASALALLCEPPVIELFGPTLSTDSRRIYVNLGQVRPSDTLELALVDGRQRLQRFATSTTLSIPALLGAFLQHDRPAIDRFFNALFDHSRQRA